MNDKTVIDANTDLAPFVGRNVRITEWNPAATNRLDEVPVRRGRFSELWHADGMGMAGGRFTEHLAELGEADPRGYALPYGTQIQVLP